MELQDVFTPNDRKGSPRRIYIRRGVELQRFGYTEGCEGCEAAKANTDPNGHTEACRARLEAAIYQDAPGRIEIARERCAKGQAAAGRNAATDIHSPAAARVYIRRTDLVRVGYTEHCPGCKAAREKRSRSINHNEECRRRVERKLQEDANTAARVERARRRAEGEGDKEEE